MDKWLSVRRGLFVLTLAFVAACSFSQAQSADEYEPKVGQEGKDVVWVPTPQALVDKMLDTAKLTSKDFLIDLGSGDGRTVITAAKRGSKALGIEYNPDMFELSKRNAAKEGVSDKASFVKADLFESDFSQAKVITMFLLPEINLKLRPKIDKALVRIDDGDYGYCDETGEEIGLERLEARPIATLCLDAQERWELRQRQMGDSR